MQFLYETEQTVSGTGIFPIVVSGKVPNRRYYIYINRILLGVAGLNIRITDPYHGTIDKFVERYWPDEVFTIDKHFINEIVIVSQADNSGNLLIGLVEYSERSDSTISPKSFTITLYGDIRE
jgi:hypothetical protein